jgi:flagellar hook-length control protein FliK
VRNAEDRKPQRAGREVADEAPAADYRAERHDVAEENANEQQNGEDSNEPVTDSDAPPEEEAGRSDEETQADEVESKETQTAAIDESGKDAEPAAVVPKEAVTASIDEEQLVDEVAQDDAGEDAVPHPGLKRRPSPAQGAKATSKAAAPVPEPVDQGEGEGEGEPETSARGETVKTKKAKPTGDAIGPETHRRDDRVTEAATLESTKADEARQVAASASDDKSDSEGRKQTKKRSRPQVRPAAPAQPNGGRTPDPAPTASSADGSPKVEKPTALAEIEQTATRTPTKDAPAETATVRASGQQPTSAPVVETLPTPTAEQRITGSVDPLAATQTTRTSGQSDAERVRFVQRVARAFQAAGEQGGKVTLRLNPPELGSVRLEVTIRDGVLRAHLEAETTAARQALLENLPALRERLAEQDVKIERFDVDLRDNGSGSDAETRTGDRREGTDSRPRQEQAERTSPVNPNQDAPVEMTAPANENGLNVIV